MKILAVCSMNKGLSPFVKEQVNSLRKLDITIDIFGIKGKGKIGYLKNLSSLKIKLKKGNYNLIHAHYGLSGLLANLQRRFPVVTTYHGSDVHLKKNVKYSKISALLSVHNILANKKLNNTLHLNDNFSIIPCGIDLKNFKPMDTDYCKQKMGLSIHKNYILFSSSFNREIKNPKLAQKAVAEIPNAELIELSGYTRKEVATLINASKLILVTSFHETGPLIVKEALACNTPVVSTDVGDVKEIIEDIEYCYLVEYNKEDVISKCQQVLNNNDFFQAREEIKKYALPVIADRIKIIYEQIISGH